MKVLVVEDDQTVGRFVSRGLEEQRYHVDLVAEGNEGLERASSSSYDVIVLDLRLPGMSGVEVLRTLRDRGVTTPVLVLTAQDAVESKVQALRTGADDYVTKPFAFEELLARVEALGRRPREIAPPVLTVADLTIDTGKHEVRRGGSEIELRHQHRRRGDQPPPQEGGPRLQAQADPHHPRRGLRAQGRLGPHADHP